MEKDTFETFRKNGIQFFDNGNYKEAMNCFDKCIQLRPSDSEIYNRRGLAKSYSGYGPAASDDFDKAMKIRMGYITASQSSKKILILANINGASTLPTLEMSQLKKACKKIEIDHICNLYSIDILGSVLEKNVENDIILFINFPPDSSYPGSGKSISEIEKEGVVYQYWEVDSYTKSSVMLRRILMQNDFRSVHFVTGAGENIISDNFLKSLTSGIKITVQRKKEWMEPGMVFYQFYKHFVIKSISEV